MHSTDQRNKFFIFLKNAFHFHVVALTKTTCTSFYRNNKLTQTFLPDGSLLILLVF